VHQKPAILVVMDRGYAFRPGDPAHGKTLWRVLLKRRSC
jgi:hypothetical protein